MTIREYLKTLLQGVKTYVDEKIVKSDWNENDETDPAYVKNRPFYSEQKIIMPKTTFTLEDQGGQYSAYIADRYELETGKNYKVICNDIEYNCTAHAMSDPGGWCLGNDLAMGGSEDTGEPFVIMILNKMAATQIGVGGVVIYNTTSPMDITVSIIEEEGIIHKLDIKFLPDGLADIALEALAECGVNTPLSNENNVVYTNSDGKIYTL